MVSILQRYSQGKKISVVLLTQIQFHEFFNTIFHNYNSKGNKIQTIFI